MDMGRVVGVALNGVAIYSGNSEYDYDAYFPKAWGGKQTDIVKIQPDLCLGSSMYSEAYHYYMFSPCIYENDVKSLSGPCSSDVNCTADIRTYSVMKIKHAQKSFMPIGIAKDGHIIYGPYSNNKVLWQPCDVDICNGLIINNQYVYVSTMFHPYTVGCWGIGSRPDLS
jgi:hypothetical protein